MKIGILGGTFNPPHLGHLVLAQNAIDKLSLDRFFFIPTHIPPHKNRGLIESSYRYTMTQLAVKDNSRIEVLDIEIQRGGISYTIDTIKELQCLCPGDELFLIIGSDLFADLSTWKNYKELQQLVTLVVALRNEFREIPDTGVVMLEIIQIGITSSLIRNLVRQGYSIRYLVPPLVEQYIRDNALYRPKKKEQA